MNKACERVRELRKSLKLSQTDFAEELGVTRSVISNIELGIVEIKEYVLRLICSKFNVSEEWLRNGTGEMFVQTPKTVLDDLVTAHNLDEREKAIISAFLDLSSEGRATVIEYIEKAATNLSSLSAPKTRDEIIAERIAAADKKIAEDIIKMRKS